MTPLSRSLPEALLHDLDALVAALERCEEAGPLLGRIGAGVGALPPSMTQALEDAVRARFIGYWSARTLDDVVRLTPAGFPRRPPGLVAWLFGVRPRSSAGLEYLFLGHDNGYLREDSVRRLKGRPWTPFLFAAMARRMNDWVEQVRLAAEHAVGDALQTAPPEVIAAAAPAVLGVSSSWGRWTQQGQTRLLGLFERPDVQRLVVEELRDAVQGPSGRVLRALLARPGLDDRLPLLAAEARTPVVRAIATQALLTGAARWYGGERVREKGPNGMPRWRRVLAVRPLEVREPFEASVLRALGDRAVIVRRLGIDALIRDWRTFEPVVIDRLLAQVAHDRDPGVGQRLEYLQRKRREESTAS